MRREEAIKIFNEVLLFGKAHCTQAEFEELAKMSTQALEQEPKTGHWYRQTNDYVDYYECSECGMAMGLYDVKNYCPNCGSRNEVEE